MSEIGKMNRRVIIRTYGASTLTATGGSVMPVPVDYETWAEVRNLSQYEALSNGLRIGQANYKFRLRYQEGNIVTQRNEIVYNGRVFRVASIINIDESNFTIEVIGTERTN